MNSLFLDHRGDIITDRGRVEQFKLHCLSYRIRLDEAFTFRSVFQMLQKYTLLKDLSPFISSFVQAFERCPEKGCVSDRCHYFDFGKTVEIIGFPGKPKMEIYPHIFGRREKDEKRVFLIRDFEMDELLDMRIVLGKLRHIIFGDQVDTFEYDAFYTIFEFIEGIFWELSFQGASKHCQWGE